MLQLRQHIDTMVKYEFVLKQLYEIQYERTCTKESASNFRTTFVLVY